MAHRFFVNKISEGKAEIKGSDFSHAVTVLRLGEGSEVAVFNQEHGEFTAEIEKIDRTKGVISLKIKEKIKDRTRPKVLICAAIALIKKDKMEFVIEKMTELGIDRILPFTAKRSVVVVKEEEKKMARWEKLVDSAMKQCGRINRPLIMPNAGSVSEIDVKGAKFLVYEKAEEKFLFDEAKKAVDSGADEIWFVTGPEGGFEDKEADELIEKGFIPVSLGDTILRAETAAIAAASSIVQAARRGKWEQPKK